MCKSKWFKFIVQTWKGYDFAARFLMTEHTGVVRKLIGAIRHPTSEIRHRTSEIRHTRFDIRHSTSEIRHSTSDIRHPTSDIPDLTSNICRHPRFDIRHPRFDIRHPTSDMRHRTSEIRHPTFGRMAVMCSSWDQGTYEERFEKKQCGLFWFCLVFLSFCIVAHAYITPVCFFIRKRAAKSYPFQVCTMNLLLHILLLHI